MAADEQGSGRQQRRLLAVLLAVSLWLPALAAELSTPAGLKDEVGFWRRVFTETSSTQSLVHDDRFLGIVYEVVQHPGSDSPTKRRRAEKSARDRYRSILNKLASGKRDGLSETEARVLSLWPDDVSNAELRSAASRLRTQQGLSDRFRAGLARSGRWRDYIARALDDAGVPAQLVALPHVESSFNPAAYSHVGASGLWQFTRGTGRRFMRIDHVIDERRDPHTSSDAAAQLLRYNYELLQSWPLAITAYNHGVAGMRRAKRNTGSDDIETIIREYRGRSFGFASRNFFVAFLAASEVDRNPDKYFGRVALDAPRAELVIKLPNYTPVGALAEAFAVPQDTLREFNPALLAPVWSGSKYVPRNFLLRVPVPGGSASETAMLARIPASQRFTEQTPDLFHTVQRGDSLSVIAARYRTSVAELVAINNLRSRHRIRAGQTLRLPITDGAVPVSLAGSEVYRVRPGDSLGLIAKRAGLKTSELLAMNNIVDANRIYVGQRLRLTAAVENRAPAPVAVAVAQAARVVEPPAAEPEPEPVVVAAGTSAEPSQADEDDAALLLDPADYLVAAGGNIEVQAAETLGHYADWLGIRTQRLRDLNGYSFRQPVVIGRRIKLDFSEVSAKEFTARRVAYHRALQEAFFVRYRVADTAVHRFRRGESLWVLTRRYEVPVWLLRQYNPDLDLDRVRPGSSIVFPTIVPADGTARRASSLADAS